MKTTARILLFVFISFIITPSVISVIKKSSDVAVFYSFSEKEKASQEIKAIFHTYVVLSTVNFNQLNSGLIHSENLSKQNKISCTIFIPPPEQV
jgi:hypothetical protein